MIASARPQFRAESFLDGFVPLDVEVSPNGALTVVRSSRAGGYNTFMGDSVAVFDNAGNRRQMSVACTNWGGGDPSFGYAWPSDLLRVTNSRAVVIGSDWDKTTYIDVLAIDVDPVECKAHYEIGTQFDKRGWVGDVEVTPDGTYAIVSHYRGIEVIRLVDGALVSSFDTSAVAWFADDMADSIVATNDYAAVVMRDFRISPPKDDCYVYIVDLVAHDPPQLVTTDPAKMKANLGSVEQAHDVELTPNGKMVVVHGEKLVSLFSLDPANPTFGNGPIGICDPQTTTNYPNSAPGYRSQADSIVVTNDRAVVIGQGVSLTNQTRARAHVLSISETAAPAMITEWTYDTLEYPHDIAIDDSGSFAAISANGGMLVVNGLASGATPAFTLVPTTCEANRDMGDGSRNSQNSWASDSIEFMKPFPVPVLPPQTNGLVRYAVMVGSAPASQGSLATRKGVITLVDVQQIGSPPIQPIDLEVVDPGYTNETVFTDLALRHSAHGIVVRASALPDEQGSPPVGRDWNAFTVDPFSGTPPAQFGGFGTVFALDSLSRNRGQCSSVSESYHPPTNVFGYVHQVTW